MKEHEKTNKTKTKTEKNFDKKNLTKILKIFFDLPSCAELSSWSSESLIASPVQGFIIPRFSKKLKYYKIYLIFTYVFLSHVCPL